MDRTKYFAALGLAPTATSADIEATYLAITQHLESKSLPASLRSWAREQAALVDEAYAALTAGDDFDEEDDEVAPRGRALPATVARSKRTERHNEEIDEPDRFEDDYSNELDDELEEEVRPPARKRSGAQTQNQSWQQRGRARPRGTVGAQRRDQQQGDDRYKKLVLGLSIGLVVVIGAFVAMQAGLFGRQAGSFGGTTPPVDQQAFDSKRYDDLKSIVAREPNNYYALMELSEMSFEAERFEETISWLERALTNKPADAYAIRFLGTAKFNVGDRKRAQELWLQSLALDPNDPQTHWNLSFGYISQQPQDIEAATREWLKVIELAPNSELANLAQQHLDAYKGRSSSASTPVPATQPPAAAPTPAQ